MIDRFGNEAPEDRAPRGRPTVLDETQLEKLWKLRRHGATLKECAAEFGVHIATVGRYITAVRRQKLEKLRANRMSFRKSAGI